MTLSGGMKRRVLIAKALAHEPSILFLDEPTAGVDVALRRDMWEMVRGLQKTGVTIILTTHYIEEAEHMADRIGVINKGEIILVEEKATLMEKLGKKQLVVSLTAPRGSDDLPEALVAMHIAVENDGKDLVYTYESKGDPKNVARFLATLGELGLDYVDVKSRESSLEDIFVDLVEERR
jgi:ABC-2 type transport system ATP-binding protein